jgi:hypothetical protein
VITKNYGFEDPDAWLKDVVGQETHHSPMMANERVWLFKVFIYLLQLCAMHASRAGAHPPFYIFLTLSPLPLPPFPPLFLPFRSFLLAHLKAERARLTRERYREWLKDLGPEKFVANSMLTIPAAAPLIAACHNEFFYGWTGRQSGSGFCDMPRPALGVVASSDRF